MWEDINREATGLNEVHLSYLSLYPSYIYQSINQLIHLDSLDYLTIYQEFRHFDLIFVSI